MLKIKLKKLVEDSVEQFVENQVDPEEELFWASVEKLVEEKDGEPVEDPIRNPFIEMIWYPIFDPRGNPIVEL